MQRTLVDDLLAQVHDRWMDDRSGEVLHGIPALENVDPDTFGICLATADGYVYEEGDTDLPFCIQSISKAFTYGMALEDNGTAQVDAKIDVEPSGDLFNEISLHPVTHRPRNPMINAGAIAASSMVRGTNVQEQIERVQGTYSDYAGAPLEIDEEIYASMQESGHRNRAISHMLREFGILECSPDDALEVYLRQCAVMVTCCDLAMMGATLANLGINPVTGKTVLPQVHMERVLSVMSTCGMYDARRRVGGVGGHGGQERGGGRHRRGAARAAGAGRVLAAAGRARQQRARRAGLPPALAGPGAARAARDARGTRRHPRLVRHRRGAVGHAAPAGRPRGARGLRPRAPASTRSTATCCSPARSRWCARSPGPATTWSCWCWTCAGSATCPTWPGGCWPRLRASLLQRSCDAVIVDPDGTLPVAAQNGGRPRAADLPHAPGRHGVVRGPSAGALRRTRSSRPRPSSTGRATRCSRTCPTKLVDELERRMEPREYADGELIVEQGDAEAGVFLIMAGRVQSSLTTEAGVVRRLAQLTPGTCFGDLYVVTGNPHLLSMHAVGARPAAGADAGAVRRRSAAADAELRAELLHLFMFAIQDDYDRVLRTLGNGRVAPMTAT